VVIGVRETTMGTTANERSMSMSTQRKRNRFLSAKRDGTSYKMKPEGNGSTGTHKSKGNGSIHLK